MFNWKVEYLTSFGAMTIHVNYYKCRAFTKYGAWRKFLRDTKNEDHYSCREYRSSFWRMWNDIKMGL